MVFKWLYKTLQKVRIERMERRLFLARLHMIHKDITDALDVLFLSEKITSSVHGAFTSDASVALSMRDQVWLNEILEDLWEVAELNGTQVPTTPVK